MDPRKKTLLFFGLIREYKGLKVLIEAFGQLDDSFQLIIAGECYEREQEYMDAINSNPLSKNIIMVNEFVNDEQVPDYFSAADAVILPYLNATQSGVTAIALHFNTPVIASKVGGLNEFINHNSTGLLVSPIGDSTALKNAIYTWFSVSRKNVETEINKWSKNFSWKKFCSDLIEFTQTT